MTEVSRRGLMGIALASTAAAAGGHGANPAVTASRSSRYSGELLTTPEDAVAATTSGRVRGFKRGPIFNFRGIPYGADTGGAARFLPPRPPDAWQGVRQTLTYGPVCPQPFPPRAGEEPDFMNDWIFGYPGEDCLRLNIWSADLDARSKRPVMVWIHGGGFIAGSGNDLPAYDGAALARRGVVLVSLNHRLGPLGFLDLSELGGERYAASGNVGLLDIVLALRWVRDNVAAFGGDPDNITIFGHSGGGGKISALMGMPAAVGLFHRVVLMSASMINGLPQSRTRAMAKAMMSQLGLAADDLSALCALPPDKLVQAAFPASARLPVAPVTRTRGWSPVIATAGPWSAVLDGQVLTEDWSERAPSRSARIPMIIGTVRDEHRARNLPRDDAELLAMAARLKPEQAPEIVAALREAFPALGPRDLGAVLGGMPGEPGCMFALDQARKHTAAGGRTYSYWFTWATPLFDGRQGVQHGFDLAHAFDNVARYDHMTGNAPEAHRVAARMSQAFVNFATTGDPGQPGLAWPPYEPGRVPTMVFDTESRMVSDPLGKLRRLLA